MAKKKTGREQLGKGLKALFQEIDAAGDKDAPTDALRELSQTVALLSLSSIKTNPYQPRTHFDREGLEELADSIKVYGLIQPITVRHLGDDQYELISGERRFRASKMAGLDEIPAYVRVANDQEMMEMALVENIQRRDLNPIEIALTYARLKEEFNFTDEQLSTRVGKGRVTVTNFLSLLKLPDFVQEGLRERKISAGHGRELARVGKNNFSALKEVYQQIIDQGLSVRQTEALINKRRGKKGATSPKSGSLPESYQNVRDNLRRRFGVKKLDIKLGKDGKGSIVIPFSSTEHLNDLLDLLDD